MGLFRQSTSRRGGGGGGVRMICIVIVVVVVEVSDLLEKINTGEDDQLRF